MPNFIGYLINDNYLFTTLAYWELEDGSENKLALRGGRRPHIVYDKNDGFGGDYYINKFKGLCCINHKDPHSIGYGQEKETTLQTKELVELQSSLDQSRFIDAMVRRIHDQAMASA